MSIIKIEAGQLGLRIRSDARGAPVAVKQAIFSAAQRARSWIVGKSPVDRGILKNAWRVVKLSEGAELVNDQPYAGIVERGSRPFKISPEGLEALTGWVKRKIIQDGWGLITGGKGAQRSAISWAAKRQQIENRSANKARQRGSYGPKRDTSMRSLRSSVLGQATQMDVEAKKIAWAIAKKFQRVGMRGKRFVWANLGIMVGLMDKEVDRYLTKFFNRAGS